MREAEFDLCGVEDMVGGMIISFWFGLFYSWSFNTLFGVAGVERRVDCGVGKVESKWPEMPRFGALIHHMLIAPVSSTRYSELNTVVGLVQYLDS